MPKLFCLSTIPTQSGWTTVLRSGEGWSKACGIPCSIKFSLNHFLWTLYMQDCSQPHSPGLARVPLSSFFPQILIIFSYFSSNFPHFLPHFGSPGGWLAHPGRPWLRHCLREYCVFAMLGFWVLWWACGYQDLLHSFVKILNGLI